jgi:endonuclease-3 related protein
MQQRLKTVYKRLLAYFGPQKWWPADTPFEVIVGAVLTQNTNWRNVEKAINNLKKEKLLNADRLQEISLKRLAPLIRPAGYFNVKAERLKNFLDVLFNSYGGNLKNMFSLATPRLRQALLDIKGIGEETADSILLYAADRPIFVVDAYTKRIINRYRLGKKKESYNHLQDLFMQNLRKDVRLFNEYHALLVKLGKDICTKSKPACPICPLTDSCRKELT